MDDSMMLDPMATHQVSILPPRDPTPTDTHLDDDPKNLAHNISNTTASPATEMTESDPVPMQIRIGSAKTTLETTNQISIAASAEAKTASIDNDTENRTNAKADPEIIEEITPAPSSEVEVSNNNYTTSASVEDATPGAGVTVHKVAQKDAAIKDINEASHIVEEIMTIESEKAEITEREVSKVIDIKSTTDESAAPEVELTKAMTSEQNGPGTVHLSISEQENSCPESLSISKPVAENTQKQDGLDLEKIAPGVEVVSPNQDPSLAIGSNSEAGNSDDTSAQVARLMATYDSSQENRTSLLETTAAEAPELVAQQHIDTATIPEGRASLFGGPVGPQIPPQTETPEIFNVGPLTQIETPKGFEDLFEEETTLEDNIVQEDVVVDMNSFDFSNSNTEQYVEPEVEAGAEQDVSSQLPSSGHDGKPAMKTSHDPTSPNYVYGPTSPAYSHTTSNNSHISHASSNPSVLSMVEFVGSEDQYNTAADNKETPEAFAELERVTGVTTQSIPEVTEELCNCEDQHCVHRVSNAFGLRPGPRKEGNVYISNLVYDNDKSGTYTDEQRYYPSAPKLTVEELEDDEETNDDGEEDHVMSGGLPTDPADPNGRFNTIPFNHTDTLIRNKRPFDEESSSSDESRTKKNKKRKKTKSKSTKATKKSKDNSGSAISRTTKSDEEEIDIDEQASTCATKTSTNKASVKKAPTKRRPSTTAPNQTILQMVQRLAKPHTTRLSYPIVFNCPAASCFTCKDTSNAINGCSSTPRKIKVYDFGQGNMEVPDADEAGNAGEAAKRPEQTQLCLGCTTGYMKILMCSTHDISHITSSAPAQASSPNPAQASPSGFLCTICAASATYTCEFNCGVHFCDTCTYKVHGEFDGDLSATLDTMTDEATAEYPRGLRADVELLRKAGELWNFLRRMARKKVAT